MSNKSSNGKAGLRFAALMRVSSERQETEGESLRTQHTHIERDVGILGGRVIHWYGGQEHGTPGYEKKQVDRMIADAENGKFDAVIVANADRWSRDNIKSREGLNAFKAHRVRFFVSTSEYDLFNPEHTLFLSMSAAFGEFQATHQSRKSIINRIERAKRGVPTCGKLPFGRTFDENTGKWGIHAEKLAMVIDVAKRYLAGEPLPKLAAEYRQNHSNLHKVLMHRSGDKWEQTFGSKALNISETVETTVPRLLPEETIQALRRRAEANKTYHHGHSKHPYLFSRMVHCGHCGYAMFGQTNANGHRYYRHAHTDRARQCPCPKAWVAAEELEQTVIAQLFENWGNRDAARKAIEEAVPDQQRMAELRQRRSRVKELLAQIDSGRERVIGFIANGALTDAQATKKLAELSKSEVGLREELEQINAALEHVPTPEAIDAFCKRMEAALKKIHRANHNPEDMTWKQRRALAETVFGGKTPEGKRMGVYVEWIDAQEKKRRKEWKFTIRGQLNPAESLASDELISTMLDAGIAGRAIMSAFLPHREVKQDTRSKLHAHHGQRLHQRQ
jgi:DNA invertase Pin-like site-specific DNA recombinase